MLSFSNFGDAPHPHQRKVSEATARVKRLRPDLQVEGEMQADVALLESARGPYPFASLEGAANVLIFAQADAASGVRNILRLKAGALEVGPILMGLGNRAHIVTPSITSRGLLNMAAVAGTPVASYG